MAECVTHHNACDCREEVWARRYREMVAERSALEAEVERLRDERTLTLNMDHLATLARLQEEIERLRDGIRRVADDLANVAAEAHEDPGGEDDPAVWARHFIASTRHRDLLALLDEGNQDV